MSDTWDYQVTRDVWHMRLSRDARCLIYQIVTWLAMSDTWDCHVSRNLTHEMVSNWTELSENRLKVCYSTVEFHIGQLVNHTITAKYGFYVYHVIQYVKCVKRKGRGVEKKGAGGGGGVTYRDCTLRSLFMLENAQGLFLYDSCFFMTNMLKLLAGIKCTKSVIMTCKLKIIIMFAAGTFLDRWLFDTILTCRSKTWPAFSYRPYNNALIDHFGALHMHINHPKRTENYWYSLQISWAR